MKTLAKGKNQQVIETMIKHLINSTQGNQFETFLDDAGIRDIAEVVESDKGLFNENEASLLNASHVIMPPGKEVKLDEDEIEHLQRSSERKRRMEEDDDLSRGI